MSHPAVLSGDTEGRTYLETTRDTSSEIHLAISFTVQIFLVNSPAFSANTFAG